jgi:hypothetical protein
MVIPFVLDSGSKLLDPVCVWKVPLIFYSRYVSFQL